MSIVDHIPGLGGLALGVLHHTVPAVGGWLKERVKSGELETAGRIALQRSSYQAWVVHLILLAILLGAFFWYHSRGDPVASVFQSWTGYGVAWAFGGAWSLPWKGAKK